MTEYLKEIDATFAAGYNTNITVFAYADTIGNDVEKWVSFLVFMRKQARFSNLSSGKEDRKKLKRIVDKCSWVGTTLVPFLFTKIPHNIYRTVVTKLTEREKQENHLEEIRKNTMKDIKPGSKIAQLDIINGETTSKVFVTPDLLGELDTDE